MTPAKKTAFFYLLATAMNTASATLGQYSALAESSCLETAKSKELECGPMPSVMAALPNIGGVAPSVQRRKIWLTPTTKLPCSNAAKTGNPLKFAVVPQCQPLAGRIHHIIRKCGGDIAV